MQRCPHCSKLFREDQIKTLRGAELLTQEQIVSFIQIWKEAFDSQRKTATEVLSSIPLRALVWPAISHLNDHAQLSEVGRILNDLCGVPVQGFELVSSGNPKAYKLINTTQF